MIRARYQGAGVDFQAFQRSVQEYLRQEGWSIKKFSPGARSFKVVAKKGFLGGKVEVEARGVPDDIQVEVKGSDEQGVMSIVERALTDCASNPSAVVSWQQQALQMAAQTAAQMATIMRQMPFGMPGARPPAPAPTAPAAAPAAPAPAQVARPQVPKPTECPNCGAPLVYSPEDLITICEYCGYTVNLTGGALPRMSMLPVLVDGGMAIEIAKDHVAKGVFITKGMAERAEWGSIVLRYIPIWHVSVQVQGEVLGEKALVKTKSTKGKILQEVALEAIGGFLGGFLGRGARKAVADRWTRTAVSEVIEVPVVARRAVAFQPEPGAYKIPLERKEPFRKTGEETLGVEVSSQEAIEKAKAAALEEVKARFTTVAQFNVWASPVGEPELIYAPWWFVEYRMGGRSFSVIVDACTGKVLAGQRPWLPKGFLKRKKEEEVA
ncbi:hypothetical protein DRO33_04680 [Candidatus Bathyarchaeota archaeon]|nr:MAG: hypothetical protein DRO33_04680 [Candidatus Bathyarchaeota archaeon]